jgi:hypothetical protein
MGVLQPSDIRTAGDCVAEFRCSTSLDDALLATALEILWRAYRYAADASVDA